MESSFDTDKKDTQIYFGNNQIEALHLIFMFAMAVEGARLCFGLILFYK